jgi:hypothetical protein
VTRAVVLAHPATGDLPFRIGAALMSGAPIATLDTCERASDLPARLAAGSDVRALVVGLYDDRGVPIAGRIASLRLRFPRLPIILYTRMSSRDSESFLAAVRSGVSQVIVRDDGGDVAALRSAIAESLASGSLLGALEAIDDLLTPDGREILDWCLGRAGKRLSVGMVANGLGRDRSTINRHLRRCGLPPTERVISWCRLLHIAWELDRGALSVARIAATLDFGVASTLRTFVRRHMGLAVSDLRLKGAVPEVMRMIRTHLEQGVEPIIAFGDDGLLAAAAGD